MVEPDARPPAGNAKYMDHKWTAHSESENRGFVDVKEGTLVKLSAATQTVQVESLIDLICVHAPELDVNHIRVEATSLNWIYNFVREHYGCRRTARQMMQKMTTLKRRPGEKLNAYWNRFKGFYFENRIRANDDIKIKTSPSAQLSSALQDEEGERYRLSSDIVLCLWMCHPELPAEIEKMHSSKLETQDVASLEREIMTKANIALEQLENRNPSVRRTNTYRPPNRKPGPQASAKTQGKTRKPTKTDHFCSSCLRNPATKGQAQEHYIKDCPYLSQSDRDYILKLHDKALLNRLVSPEERDPSVSVRFMDMVESYYDLASPNVNQIGLQEDDLLPDAEGPSSGCLNALADLDIEHRVVRISGDTPYWQSKVQETVLTRHVSISPSTSFPARIWVDGNKDLSVQEDIVVDTGCT